MTDPLMQALIDRLMNTEAVQSQLLSDNQKLHAKVAVLQNLVGATAREAAAQIAELHKMLAVAPTLHPNQGGNWSTVLQPLDPYRPTTSQAALAPSTPPPAEEADISTFSGLEDDD